MPKVHLALIRSTLRDLFLANRSLLLFIILMSVFRSSVADWNYVPSGSMRPTIIEGDRVLINKLAYDVQIPFVHRSIAKLADPVRGDIVVFKSAAAGKRLIKRVVGVPGDSIAIIQNRLIRNGVALSYALVGQDQEQFVLLERSATTSNRMRPGAALARGLDGLNTISAAPYSVVVPDGFYLVLGDNRNNSADSRYYGLVPRNEIIGRSATVVFSHDPERYFIPRRTRWFENLDLAAAPN